MIGFDSADLDSGSARLLGVERRTLDLGLGLGLCLPDNLHWHWSYRGSLFGPLAGLTSVAAYSSTWRSQTLPFVG